MERLSHARAVEGLSGGCRGDTTIKDMNNNVRQNGLCRRVLAACVLGAAVLPGVADDRHRPHIVLVMLDDMGFSDLGCYGGEVETPHRLPQACAFRIFGTRGAAARAGLRS